MSDRFDFHTSPIDYPNVPLAARCCCSHAQSWHRAVTGTAGGYCRWCSCTAFAYMPPPAPSRRLEPEYITTAGWPPEVIFAVAVPIVALVAVRLLLG